MDELKTQLRQADDAYLAGLSNKGTVKRAHKDLEQETPQVRWDADGDAVQVTFKEAVCRIRAPLGSSTCSCPSRSICRHVAAAILYVSGTLEKEDASSEASAPVPEAASLEASAPVPGPASLKAAAPEPAPPTALEEALLAVPLSRLKRACRDKAFREFAARAEAGELPSLEMGNVITVRFPWGGQTVKLLYPLEYSSCTCRSKVLCTHKAQAVLAFQLQRKALTVKMLKEQMEDADDWDREAVSQAARSIKEGIRLSLFTGLSRLSPEAAQSMERLAVICHGAGLPAFETDFRSAAAEYEQYFSRSASFHEEWLLARLLSLYGRACLLEETKERDVLQNLAGTFRDAYLPVPDLKLTAVGSRHVKSKAGYEGEKYYFLEAEQRRWYTWMDVRPVFYEGVRRRPAGRDGREQAPWGLNCSREKMMELEFALTQAKAAQDGRLSASRETRSEVLGARRLDRPEIREMVFRDYGALLRGLERREQKAEKFYGQRAQVGEALALVEAAEVREGTFDAVRQRFSMEIFDSAGRKLSVAVNYSKEEKLIIQVLERLGKRLAGRRGEAQGGSLPLVFFGIPYLEEGRLCLYPIAYFENIRGDLQAPVQASEPAQNREEPMAFADAVKSLGQFLEDIRRALTDLFQSGLLSPQEELLARLRRLGQESGAMGLSRAGKELARLADILEEQRHQLRPEPEPAIRPWMELMEYVRLGKKRTAFDLAFLEMNAEIAGGQRI